MTKLHPRTLMVQKAGAEIRIDIANLLEKYPEIDYGEVLHSYSQSISNLFLSEKTFIGDFHKEFESCLEGHKEKHGLTVGEISQLLASAISNDSKYLIRWERHGNFESEGDFE